MVELISTITLNVLNLSSDEAINMERYDHPYPPLRKLPTLRCGEQPRSIKKQFSILTSMTTVTP